MAPMGGMLAIFAAEEAGQYCQRVASVSVLVLAVRGLACLGRDVAVRVEPGWKEADENCCALGQMSNLPQHSSSNPSRG